MSPSSVLNKFVRLWTSIFNKSTFWELLLSWWEKCFLKLTLNVLIFARIIFHSFCKFWSYSQIIVCAKYHKTSHPQNLINAKYQEKYLLNMKIDSKKQITMILAIFDEFFSWNNKMKQYNMQRFFMQKLFSGYFMFCDQQV